MLAYAPGIGLRCDAYHFWVFLLLFPWNSDIGAWFLSTLFFFTDSLKNGWLVLFSRREKWERRRWYGYSLLSNAFDLGLMFLKVVLGCVHLFDSYPYVTFYY